MFEVYAVFPADYAPGEQAVAIFSDRADAEFFVSANEDADREFSARLIIQPWEVSNVSFMEASA